MKSSNIRVQRYIWLSLIPAFAVIMLAIMADPYPSIAVPQVVYPLLCGLTWVGEEYRVKTRQSSWTLTATIHLPLILLCTPLEALVLAAGGWACASIRRRRPVRVIAYNTVVRVVGVGVPALGLLLWRAHDVRFWGSRSFLSVNLLQGIIHERGAPQLMRLAPWPSTFLSVELLLGCILAALLYFALDSALIATIVAVQTTVSPMTAWQANIRSTLLPEITKSVLGIIAACVTVINPFFVTFIVLPVAVTHVTIQAIVRLERETIDAITELANQIDLRDRYTARHSERVAAMAHLFAQRLGLSRDQVDEIELAARVHDLGKMSMPNEILLKSGPLTAEEITIMQHHPVLGAEILHKYRNFQGALPIVRHHHERYDGRGYPDRLSGAAIPLGAQIVAHADSYDAMTSDRPYRRGMTPEIALRRIAEASGTQFNPHIVGEFVAMMREELAASGRELPPTGGSLAEGVLDETRAAEEKVRYLHPQTT